MPTQKSDAIPVQSHLRAGLRVLTPDEAYEYGKQVGREAIERYFAELQLLGQEADPKAAFNDYERGFRAGMKDGFKRLEKL